MSYRDTYEAMCKKCYIKYMKPSKKDIKRMVMSEDEEYCECCGRRCQIVEYIEDGE